MSPLSLAMLSLSAFGTSVVAGIIAHLIREHAIQRRYMLSDNGKAFLYLVWRLFDGVKIGMWWLACLGTVAFVLKLALG